MAGWIGCLVPVPPKRTAVPTSPLPVPKSFPCICTRHCPLRPLQICQMLGLELTSQTTGVANVLAEEAAATCAGRIPLKTQSHGRMQSMRFCLPPFHSVKQASLQDGVCRHSHTCPVRAGQKPGSTMTPFIDAPPPQGEIAGVGKRGKLLQQNQPRI